MTAEAKYSNYLIVFLSIVMSVSPSMSLAKTYDVDGMILEMVSVPSGTFIMGNAHGDPDETPVHPVTLDSFEIGRFEITVKQFTCFVNETNYRTTAESKGDMDWKRERAGHVSNKPVTCISWHDANAFCVWLSEKTGEYFRLPTEAEWEYAALADASHPQTRYDRLVAVNALDAQSWNKENSQRDVHPVGSKLPNAWGIHDMPGNVYEWMLDVYHPKHRQFSDGAPNMRDSLPKIARRYVLKGGSFGSDKMAGYPSYRYRAFPDVRREDFGFRVVKGKKYERSMEHTEEYNPFESDSIDGNGLDIEMIKVPPGSYCMGFPTSPAPEWFQPIRKRDVRIDYVFYIGKYEITVEQFEMFVSDFGYVTDAEKQGWAYVMPEGREWTPAPHVQWKMLSFYQRHDHPVSCVSWHDAMEFCLWLSSKTGYFVTLPTVSEWEYACRAGTQEDFAGPVYDLGWLKFNSGNTTHKIGMKAPNQWGIYDMHGNVWEWNLDMWENGFFNAPVDGSAWMESDRFIPVQSGGSFINPPQWAASYVHIPSGRYNYNQGFRIVIKNPKRCF